MRQRNLGLYDKYVVVCLLLSCSRLNGAYLARKRHPRRDLEEDIDGTQVIPIIVEAPQSNSRLNSFVGDKEDLGIYAELRVVVEVEDKLRMYLPCIGTSHRDL